jgi:hypothetical protein
VLRVEGISGERGLRNRRIDRRDAGTGLTSRKPEGAWRSPRDPGAKTARQTSRFKLTQLTFYKTLTESYRSSCWGYRLRNFLNRYSVYHRVVRFEALPLLADSNLPRNRHLRTSLSEEVLPGPRHSTSQFSIEPVQMHRLRDNPRRHDAAF